MANNLTDICYKRNHLVNVVARIDFLDSAKSLEGKVLPDDLQNAIRNRYEIYEPSTALIQGIEVSDTGISTQKEEFNRWIYHGSEREKTISLSKQTIDINLKRYSNYDNFKLDVLDPIKKFQEIENDAYAARTGLRFINIFSGLVGSTSEIKDYFSPMLSGQFIELYDPEHCSRSFLVTEYLYGEIKMRLQTGIFNPDYPAKMKKLDFIVDIDAFIDIPHSFAKVERYIDNLHTKIQEHFESSITQKLRDNLNEIG